MRRWPEVYHGDVRAPWSICVRVDWVLLSVTIIIRIQDTMVAQQSWSHQVPRPGSRRYQPRALDRSALAATMSSTTSRMDIWIKRIAIIVDERSFSHIIFFFLVLVNCLTSSKNLFNKYIIFKTLIFTYLNNYLIFY
jgi:hypothetical protein